MLNSIVFNISILVFTAQELIFNPIVDLTNYVDLIQNIDTRPNYGQNQGLMSIFRHDFFGQNSATFKSIGLKFSMCCSGNLSNTVQDKEERESSRSYSKKHQNRDFSSPFDRSNSFLSCHKDVSPIHQKSYGQKTYSHRLDNWHSNKCHFGP